MTTYEDVVALFPDQKKRYCQNYILTDIITEIKYVKNTLIKTGVFMHEKDNVYYFQVDGNLHSFSVAENRQFTFITKQIYNIFFENLTQLNDKIFRTGTNRIISVVKHKKHRKKPKAKITSHRSIPYLDTPHIMNKKFSYIAILRKENLIDEKVYFELLDFICMFSRTDENLNTTFKLERIFRSYYLDCVTKINGFWKEYSSKQALNMLHRDWYAYKTMYIHRKKDGKWYALNKKKKAMLPGEYYKEVAFYNLLRHLGHIKKMKTLDA